jgi:hypothetical protein
MAKLVKFTEVSGQEIYVNSDLVTYLRPHQATLTVINFGPNHIVTVKGDLDTVAQTLARGGAQLELWDPELVEEVGVVATDLLSVLSRSLVDLAVVTYAT